MTILDELLALDRVAAVGEFAPDGKIIAYKSKTDLLKGIAEISAQFCATISMLFSTLARAYATTTHWIPQKVWSYSGGDWTVVIVVNGNRAVFVKLQKQISTGYSEP
jgi:roadblock/LC7 domain-containing protein